MMRPIHLLILLLLAAMCWYFFWEISPLKASQGQSGRSSEPAQDRKNAPEVSFQKSHNSTPNNSRQEKCDSTAEPVSDAEVLERRLPKCLIIGFSKCGTYALKSFLTLHPDIVSPNLEISFFTKFYHKGLDWYRHQMPLSAESAVTLEKTPNYILSMEALSRIRAFNASIRLIISVRDPFTRLLSSYAHTQATVRLFNETLESWLAKDGIIAWVADYEKHIRNVLRLFNSSQVLLLQEERLASEPLSVMGDVEQFLGLCHALTDHLFVFDTNKGFYCFNQSSPRYKEIQQNLTLDHTSGCFTSSKGRSHPAVGQRLRRQLVEKLAPYNEKLFALVGQRFNWTRSE